MVKNFFKIEQTGHGVSHEYQYLESKAKGIFYSLPSQKIRLSYGNLPLIRITNFRYFSKIDNFDKVIKLSKKNQTWYGKFPVYRESKTKKML